MIHRQGPRLLVLLFLVAAGWKVYGVRQRMAEGDADPRAVAALKGRLDALPKELEDGYFTGEAYEVDAEIVEESGADSYASILYADPDGASYRIYIGGSVGKQESFHAPSYCMPSSGWEILSQDTVPFGAYETGDDEPRMRRLVLQYGAERMIVYYWFQAGNHLANHEWIVRWYRFLDLLWGEPFRPTMIVTLYVPVRGTVDRTEAQAARFLRALGPSLRDAILTGNPNS